MMPSGRFESLYPEASARRWRQALFVSLILVFVLMTGMSFWYGISGDEMDMNAYGKAILDYFLTFGKDTTALNPPKAFDRDGVLQYYGGFFDLIAALVNKVSPLKEYTTRHILNAWTGFLAIFFAARICLRLGGHRLALWCTWLMFLAPFFLGHAMNNPKDVPFATAYIAAIYFFIRFYERFPGVRWTDYILPVVSLGIAIDIRVAGILLIPYMFVWLAGQYLLFKDKRPTLRKLIPALLLISGLGYLFASVFWPYALQNPIVNPIKALQQLSHFKVGLAQLYEGERIYSFNLPATYLVHNFFITNTYILIVGLIFAPLFMLANIRSRSFPLILFLTFITVFPVAYIMYEHANVYHAWRHVLFIFPSAAVVAAYGLDGIWKWVGKGSLRYVLSALLLVGFLAPGYFIVRTFPNTICYYNFFAGGVKSAYYNYEMDYYYNSLKEATDWFIKHELPKLKNKDSIVVGANNAQITGEYFKDYPKIKVRYVRFYQRSLENWDYGIFHRALIPADQLQNGSWVIDSLVHATTIEGLPLTIIAKRPSHEDYIGFSLLKENKIQEGIRHLLRYHQVDPKNELVNGLLAKYYLTINQLDSARYFAEETLKVSPESADGRMVMSALNNLRRQ